MSNKYKYGVSYNCTVGRNHDVGGGGEGYTSIDFIGNDLQKILDVVCKEDPAYIVSYDHEYINKGVDIANDEGEVVAVILEDCYGDNYVVAVVFTHPAGPEVIE